MKDTITMNEIRATSTWSVKDNSPRGCKTVSNSEVKPGDKVVYNNRFTLVIDATEPGEFNPNRDYFRYNGYGNLVSADYKDYSGQLDRYAVESMSENRDYIDSIDQSDELAALFDELEEL